MTTHTESSRLDSYSDAEFSDVRDTLIWRIVGWCLPLTKLAVHDHKVSSPQKWTSDEMMESRAHLQAAFSLARDLQALDRPRLTAFYLRQAKARENSTRAMRVYRQSADAEERHFRELLADGGRQAQEKRRAKREKAGHLPRAFAAAVDERMERDPGTRLADAIRHERELNGGYGSLRTYRNGKKN